MTYTNQEIYDALQLIQNICQTTECAKCPFNTGGICRITDEGQVPEDWIFK